MNTRRGQASHPIILLYEMKMHIDAGIYILHMKGLTYHIPICAPN